MRTVLALMLTSFVPACSCAPARDVLDASADAAGMLDASADAAGMLDASADAAHVPDASADAGASDADTPVCPAVGGGYTLFAVPTGTCPAGGPNSYGFALSLDEDTCVLTFSGNDDALNILHLTGASMIDEAGALGPTTLTLNDTTVTCTATFTVGSPNLYAFACGGCMFTIRYGE